MATALTNGDYICIVAQSAGMMAYPEPSASPHYLSPNVDDAALGSALRAALASGSVLAWMNFWKSGVIENIENDRGNWIKKQYGYKTKRAMYKNMDACNVSSVDGQIKFNQRTKNLWMDIRSGRMRGHFRCTFQALQPMPSLVPCCERDLGAAPARSGEFLNCLSGSRAEFLDPA